MRSWCVFVVFNWVLSGGARFGEQRLETWSRARPGRGEHGRARFSACVRAASVPRKRGRFRVWRGSPQRVPAFGGEQIQRHPKADFHRRFGTRGRQKFMQEVLPKTTKLNQKTVPNSGPDSGPENGTTAHAPNYQKG